MRLIKWILDLVMAVFRPSHQETEQLELPFVVDNDPGDENDQLFI